MPLRTTILAVCLSVALPLVAAEPPERKLGLKYSPLKQITRDNVSTLELAWVYSTGDIPEGQGITAFQDEPLLIEGNLVVCSNSRQLHAIDPATGQLRWKYDPNQIDTGPDKCRGVAAWTDETAPQDALCRTRLFLGTKDYRLVAVDAKTGRPCDSFGEGGAVKMETSVPEAFPFEVTALSRPAMVNDVVVVGSSVMDNQRVASPSGRVLAFDARSGEEVWAFDPIPRSADNPAAKSWENGVPVNGGANVWSGLIADDDLDLVYLPTTSPSVDFYGGERPGDNLYANSVVALKGKTGEVAWHFQIVHHDVWDYDLPTQGILIDYPVDGVMVPAIVQNTKQGMIFIFNRETGEPLVPIEERAVPQEPATPGEKLSPTQPFPVGMPLAARHGFSLDDAWGFTPIDEWLCRSAVEELAYGDIYTPPSLQGTIYMPSPSGGPDWGGGAYDPQSGVMVVPYNTVAMIMQNIPASEVGTPTSGKVDLSQGFVFSNAGSAYGTRVKPYLSPLGAPCTAPPWAEFAAIDIVNKKVLWRVPLGDISKLAPIPVPLEWGTPAVGAPLVTAGGLAFLGYSLDHQFRAFDLRTGEVLWQAELPAPANSVPVSYEIDGRQYIVVPAGGHSMFGTELSDAVMAFRLP